MPDPQCKRAVPGPQCKRAVAVRRYGIGKRASDFIIKRPKRLAEHTKGGDSRREAAMYRSRPFQSLDVPKHIYPDERRSGFEPRDVSTRRSYTKLFLAARVRDRPVKIPAGIVLGICHRDIVAPFWTRLSKHKPAWWPWFQS